MATYSNLKVGQFDPASTGLASPALPGLMGVGAQTIAGAKTMVLTDFNGAAPGGFRNRLLNGDMSIDQRFNGATNTNPGISAQTPYITDRWRVLQSGNQHIASSSQINPANVAGGFQYALRMTSVSATILSGDLSAIENIVEGVSMLDLAWGTSSAKPMVLSFWARVSGTAVTGTYSGALNNAAVGPRSYAFNFNITATGVWQYFQIAIPGDQSGTWTATNSGQLRIAFNTGTGSTGQVAPGSWTTAATAYASTTGTTSIGAVATGGIMDITGVQFEVGTVATPFEFRGFGAELALCRRYFHKPEFQNVTSAFAPFAVGYAASGTAGTVHFPFPTQMRVIPSLIASSTVGNLGVTNSSGSTLTLTSIALNANALGFDAVAVNCGVASGLVAGNIVHLVRNNNASAAAAFVSFEAEV